MVVILMGYEIVWTTCRVWASRLPCPPFWKIGPRIDRPQVLYLAGSPYINVPWGADGYSPLDMTLLDSHLGTIAEWQAAITEIHKRGMYVLLDNTMST